MKPTVSVAIRRLIEPSTISIVELWVKDALNLKTFFKDLGGQKINRMQASNLSELYPTLNLLKMKMKVRIFSKLSKVLRCKMTYQNR